MNRTASHFNESGRFQVNMMSELTNVTPHTYNEPHRGVVCRGLRPEPLAAVQPVIGELHVCDPQRDVSIFQLRCDEARPVAVGRIFHVVVLAAVSVQDDHVRLQAFLGPLHSWKVIVEADVEAAGEDDVSAHVGQDRF